MEERKHTHTKGKRLTHFEISKHTTQYAGIQELRNVNTHTCRHKTNKQKVVCIYLRTYINKKEQYHQTKLKERNTCPTCKSQEKHE